MEAKGFSTWYYERDSIPGPAYLAQMGRLNWACSLSWSGCSPGRGVFTEDFQEKGRPPEYARVRFSSTLSKEARGWQVLMFHRDIQPFEEDGTYPRELTLRRS